MTLRSTGKRRRLPRRKIAFHFENTFNILELSSEPHEALGTSRQFAKEIPPLLPCIFSTTAGNTIKKNQLETSWLLVCLFVCLSQVNDIRVGLG